LTATSPVQIRRDPRRHPLQFGSSVFTVNIMVAELRQSVITQLRHSVSKYCRR
jgi:hypothetical protein